MITAKIDCENRLGLCKAACCRFEVVLAVEEVGAGFARSAEHPMMIAKAADGYCAHLRRPGCTCERYESRPGECRVYDCRRDRRIWIDFEARIPNPELAGIEGRAGEGRAGG